MKSTIRMWLGTTLIIGLLLLVFKKPLSYPEMQHAVLAPYYVDFWVLDLQAFWPFDGEIDSKIASFNYGTQGNAIDKGYASSLNAACFFSGIIWIAVHLSALFFGGIGIYNVFFKPHRS